MKSMRCVIPVILLSFIVHEGTAKPTAQIHFMDWLLRQAAGMTWEP